MIFVEGLRLFVVLVGVLVGSRIAEHAGANARFLGATLGALFGYVLGGILGRMLHRGLGRAAGSVRDLPATEVLAGTLLGSLGAIIGASLCTPLFVFLYSVIDFPIAAGVALVLAELGRRVGMAKAQQLADSVGLTRKLSGRSLRAATGALVLDSSAVMDRTLLTLGRFGLLPDHILVPEFVLEEVTTIAEGPDAVSSRRARRGLESLDALRQLGHAVDIAAGTVPSAERADAKVIVLAGELNARVATCSGALVAAGEELGLGVLDLRRLAGELGPDHIPGESLRIDLVRAGSQPHQAVGYLPGGDMVVVNDAEQYIGSAEVEVEVLSTRQTSQGLLVFARLAESQDQAAFTAATS